MKSIATHVMYFFLLTVSSIAQYQNVAIDTVRKFTPGTGQNSGQGPAFFPANIFGQPDPTASDSVPSTNPRQVCSIGLDGLIEVGFKNFIIVDGPGADFTVFENAFRVGKNRVYMEPGVVEVSKDGIVWIAFPYDTTTYKGCAGLTPSSGSDPFDPEKSGGDIYDLATIGADSIRWIRITDITKSILSKPKSPLYDPTLTGFDLDAIVSRHAISQPLKNDLIELLPQGNALAYVTKRAAELHVVDVSGKLIDVLKIPIGVNEISLDPYPRGAMLFTLFSSDGVFTLKVLK